MARPPRLPNCEPYLREEVEGSIVRLKKAFVETEKRNNWS